MLDVILAKVFGTKNERQVKALRPLVAAINDLEPAMLQLSDQDLARKTLEFRERLAQGAPLDDLLVEAFAVVREAGRRRPQNAPFRRSARGRRDPAPGKNRRNEDR